MQGVFQTQGASGPTFADCENSTMLSLLIVSGLRKKGLLFHAR
jgi:hypothetical protein